MAGFGALCAYTVDGGEAGEFEEENFNADELQNHHQRDQQSHRNGATAMVNAVIAAADLIAGIPAGMRPETTDGRQGFLHPDAIEGDPERVTMRG